MWPVFYYRGFLTSSTFRRKQRLGEARYAVQVKKNWLHRVFFCNTFINIATLHFWEEVV
jgi:hypothetical protein